MALFHWFKRASAAVLATLALASPAHSQLITQPTSRTLDENGVDLGTGEFILSLGEGSIGSGLAELALVRVSVGDRPSQWDEIVFQQRILPAQGDARARIGLPGRIDQPFTAPLSGGDYVPEIKYGETLKATATGFEYSVADGSRIIFDFQSTGSNLCDMALTTCELFPSRIVYPNGNVVTFTHAVYQTTSGQARWRIASIANSYGYSIDFAYQTSGTGGAAEPPAGWYTRTSATFKKSGSTQSTVSYVYPSAGTVDITDPAGAVWRITASSIRRPNEASPGFVATGNPVTVVTRDGVTTNYARTVAGSVVTMTKTNALGQTMVVQSTGNRPTSVINGLNKTTTYQYDGSARLTRITQPEGNYVDYTLDDRGNATTTTVVAKSGSGLANIVTTATYPATCTNKLTCNRPTSTTDARGQTADYTYDPDHGGVLTVTSPAPTGGAVRPQTRYSYTAVNGVTSLTGTSSCATGTAPSCIGTANESRTSVVFDASGNMTSSSARDGTGALIAPTIMTYDGKGNLLTADGPLPGTGDTTRYRYDAARRLIGVVGPNPDGAGPLKHRATRNTYRTDGQLSKVERGTVNSQSDPDWAAFTPVETMDIGFDASNRPITRKLSVSLERRRLPSRAMMLPADPNALPRA